MSLKLLSFYRFHLFRLLRAQPGLFAALAIASLATVFSALAFVHQWQQADSAEFQLGQLRAKEKQGQSELNAAEVPTHAALALPVFDSAKLVNSFHQLAAENKLALGEISYALDDSANQPYLRYRVTLAVSTSYPVIRHFVDSLSADLPHVALDGISCAREDIGAVNLNCDLVFSSIFKKDGHG